MSGDRGKYIYHVAEPYAVALRYCPPKEIACGLGVSPRSADWLKHNLPGAVPPGTLINVNGVIARVCRRCQVTRMVDEYNAGSRTCRKCQGYAITVKRGPGRRRKDQL